MTDPQNPDESTSGETEDVPATSHGDPLLAASEGATEGTEGTRHGAGATRDPRED